MAAKPLRFPIKPSLQFKRLLMGSHRNCQSDHSWGFFPPSCMELNSCCTLFVSWLKKGYSTFLLVTLKANWERFVITEKTVMEWKIKDDDSLLLLEQHCFKTIIGELCAAFLLSRNCRLVIWGICFWGFQLKKNCCSFSSQRVFFKEQLAILHVDVQMFLTLCIEIM